MFIPFSCCAVVDDPPADATVAQEGETKAEASALVVGRSTFLTGLPPHTILRYNPVPSNLRLPAEDARHNGLYGVSELVLNERSVIVGHSYSMHQETLAPRDFQDTGTFRQNPSKLLPRRAATSSLSTSDEVPSPMQNGTLPAAPPAHITEERPCLNQDCTPPTMPPATCECIC